MWLVTVTALLVIAAVGETDTLALIEVGLRYVTEATVRPEPDGNETVEPGVKRMPPMVIVWLWAPWAMVLGDNEVTAGLSVTFQKVAPEPLPPLVVTVTLRLPSAAVLATETSAIS